MNIKKVSILMYVVAFVGMLINWWYHGFNLWNGWEAFIDGACMLIAGLGLGIYITLRGIEQGIDDGNIDLGPRARSSV